jgi:hypothetical protein
VALASIVQNRIGKTILYLTPAVFYHCFIDQQNGDVVPHGINAMARAALKAFAGFLLHQWLLTDGTNQDVEQFLRNHAGILRLNPDCQIPVASCQFQTVRFVLLRTERELGTSS